MALTDDQIRARRVREREHAQRRRRRRRGLPALALAALLAALVAAALPGGGGRGAHAGSGGPAQPVRGIAPARPGRARLIQRGAASSGEVAISFDDGFCSACLARIVDVLWRDGAHATFFPNGTYAASWRQQARRIRAMVNRGQVVVGNHTFTHHDPRTESSDAFGADLARNEGWIERTFGVSGRPWFRPPYGSYNAATLATAGQQGYTQVVLWSGTLADSRPQTIPYLLKAARDWGHPGIIILAHANYPNTGQALPQILDILRARHLRLVTVAELARGAR